MGNIDRCRKENGILLTPGDVKWKDINGDGMIDSFDQKYLVTRPRIGQAVSRPHSNGKVSHYMEHLTLHWDFGTMTLLLHGIWVVCKEPITQVQKCSTLGQKATQVLNIPNMYMRIS